MSHSTAPPAVPRPLPPRAFHTPARLLGCEAVSDALRPHGLCPTRPLCPWTSLGRSPGVPLPPPGTFPDQWPLACLLHFRRALTTERLGTPPYRVRHKHLQGWRPFCCHDYVFVSPLSSFLLGSMR